MLLGLTHGELVEDVGVQVGPPHLEYLPTDALRDMSIDRTLALGQPDASLLIERCKVVAQLIAGRVVLLELHRAQW